MISRELEQAASKVFILSDEKMFTLEAVTNKQTEKPYARGSRDVLVNVRGNIRRQKPVCGLVRAAVASDREQISLGLH